MCAETNSKQGSVKTGVQLSKVTGKLNGVTDGGRRKLSVVTDGATGTFTGVAARQGHGKTRRG